jgi:hypothetical protein
MAPRSYDAIQLPAFTNIDKQATYHYTYWADDATTVIITQSSSQPVIFKPGCLETEDQECRQRQIPV